jgi:hypothetical protein
MGLPKMLTRKCKIFVQRNKPKVLAADESNNGTNLKQISCSTRVFQTEENLKCVLGEAAADNARGADNRGRRALSDST